MSTSQSIPASAVPDSEHRRPRFVALGEILWDIFPAGARFGGAPANFLCHAAELGSEAWMIGAVGDDDLGRHGLHELRQHGVETELIQTLPGLPTGTVPVELDAHGKPTFEIVQNVAWDEVGWNPAQDRILQQADVVCFGTLGQRKPIARETIRRGLSVARQAVRLFDINLRPPFYAEEVIRESLLLATLLKLNDDELPILAALLGLSGTVQQQLAALLDRYSLDLVALTRGSKGSLLMQSTGEISEHPGSPATVIDTVGAGDAFTATLAVGLCRGLPLDVINEHANRVAAYVCSQQGATPRLPPELRAFPISH